MPGYPPTSPESASPRPRSTSSRRTRSPSSTATQTTTSTAFPNLHAAETDPLANLLTRGGRCPVHEASDGEVSAGPGVATYDSPPLESDVTMVGPARITVPYTATGSELQLNARVYDLDAEAGIQVLADRGFRALSEGSGEAVIHLLGHGWRFPAGHRIRLELAQDDDPYQAEHAAVVDDALLD